MTKEQFVNRMAKNGKINKVAAYEYVNLFIDTLLECLKEDGEVKINNFGKFNVKTVKEKIGRNPKNGNLYPVPSHKTVKFKAGKRYFDEVNEMEADKCTEE